MNRLVRTLFENLEYPVFSTADIVNFESDPDIRYALVKRAVKDGDLVRIRRGLYTFAPALRKRPVNAFSIANRMYYPSYISLVSALRNHGWIPEGVVTVTSVTSRNSAEFDTPIGPFTFRRIPQKLFFCGVEVVSDGAESWLQARPLKALADYVYVNRLDWTSRRPIIESLRIEEEEIESLGAADFDEIQGAYTSAETVERFLAGLRKELSV